MTFLVTKCWNNLICWGCCCCHCVSFGVPMCHCCCWWNCCCFYDKIVVVPMLFHVSCQCCCNDTKKFFLCQMITTRCCLCQMFLMFFQFLASSESIRCFVPKHFKKQDQVFKTILLDVKIIGIKEKKTYQCTLLTTLSSPIGNFVIDVIF